MKIGKVTENIFKRSVLQQIKTKRCEMVNGAGPGEDCAIFSLNSLFSDSKNDGHVMISCLKGGSLPVAAVLQKCENTLAARGSQPVAVALNILLPSHAEEELLKEIMMEAELFCGACNIQIAQADSQVTEAVKEAYVTASMYGAAAVPGMQISAAAFHTAKGARPGQDIVMSKWIGLEGTAILADRRRESILERYPAWLAEEAAGFEKYLSTVPEAAVAMKSGVCAMQNLSEGGVFAALWELAEGAGVGLTIELKKLPIRQETVEICNLCNINPYELLSGGSLLMTTSDGPGLVTALETEGIPAVIVGKITDSNDRLILNDEEVRYLDRPHADSIYENLKVPGEGTPF